jgi:hypothetical protein
MRSASIAGCLVTAILVGPFWVREVNGMAETNLKNVELQVTETLRSADTIQFEYRVRNGTSEPIYLLDRPGRDVHGGGVVLDLNFANVLFTEPDTVRIVRGILPIPLDRGVAKRAPTFLTKVDPGQTAVRSLSIPLPLIEKRSYYSDDEKPTGTKRTVSRARLELGFTEPRPGMGVKEWVLPQGPELVLEGHWAPPYQRVLTATIPISPTELRLHSEPFERAELIQ